jgi:hypothetical protein
MVLPVVGFQYLYLGFGWCWWGSFPWLCLELWGVTQGFVKLREGPLENGCERKGNKLRS